MAIIQLIFASSSGDFIEKVNGQCNSIEFYTKVLMGDNGMNPILSSKILSCKLSDRTICWFLSSENFQNRWKLSKKDHIIWKIMFWYRV